MVLSIGRRVDRFALTDLYVLNSLSLSLSHTHMSWTVVLFTNQSTNQPNIHTATGAVLMAGKGIGKGVTTGDGRAVVDGFSNAAVSVGSGVGQGVESAVMGAADGVMAVGQGLFSGVKNVGMGIGGAFSGKKRHRKPSQGRR